VSVAGSHIASLTSRGMAPVSGSRSVQEDDLDRAMQAAKAIAIPHNREVLHVVPRSYTLDGQEGIRHPVGMHAFRLEVDAHIITAASSSLANLEQASESAGIYVDRFILNPLASADAVLSEQERESGVVVIDIGGGTTDIAIYVEGTVWHTAVIAIGGDHVTNDITYLLNAPFALAEDVKIKHGHARQRDVNALENFLVEPFGDGVPQEISRKELAMVIEARVEEIFELVQKEIKRSGYDGLLRAGAVITGGSSQIQGMKEVASAVFNSPVRMAKPEKLTGMADILKNPSYSTSVGLLRMGLEFDGGFMEDEIAPGGTIPGSGFGQMLGDFLRRLLPDDREE